jgi:preprotein translocase subunit SecB
MAEQNQGAQTDAAAPSFTLQRVYLKDLSLELPNAPQIFLEQDAAQVEVSIEVGGQPLNETLFESTVKVTVTTRIKDKVFYLVEAKQAGIFELVDIPKDQINALHGIVCPTMLYPYVRSNVADAITRASLPALHLAEFNFQALFEQRSAQAQADTNDSPAPESGIVLPPHTTPQ